MVEKTRDDFAMMPFEKPPEFGSMARVYEFIEEEMPPFINLVDAVKASLKAEAKMRYMRADAMLEARDK